MRQKHKVSFAPLLIFLANFVLFLDLVSSHALNSRDLSPIITSNYSGSEYLDNESKYLLSWTINDEEEIIYFEITAQTTGYVGFGISPSGSMNEADVFIAGVLSNGSLYSSDYHGVGNTLPISDTYNNWYLTSAEETETHTKLSFYRSLNTCDDEDLPITDGTMRLIWSLGQTDEITYHGQNRGIKSVNFYLQNEQFEPEKYAVMDLLVRNQMPSEHTSYWCTIHKGPIFDLKHHIVAFEAVLENELALKHTHHFILRRCIAPPGEDPEDLFDPWVGHSGDYCYGPSNSSFPFLQYCSQHAVYVWSKGGKRLVFPPNLGLPIPEGIGQRDYYSLDIHYDNPEELSNIEFTTGARFYYTSELREIEIGLLRIYQELLPQFTIPPKTSDYIANGHCSGGCTQKYLPSDGVTMFNNLLHAHLAGRKLKLRHFRGEQELPWVDNDEYYDFDFQQNKQLLAYRKVERGDQLTVECTYDTMYADGGKAVLGGLGTREEMCEAIVYFYPKVDFTFCGSYQDMDEHFNFLGMTAYRLKNESEIAGAQEYEILQPEELAGDYRDSVSFKVNWTNAFRERYQNEKRFGEQIGFCTDGSEDENYMESVKYPDNLNVYVPPDECDGYTPGPTPLPTTSSPPGPGFEEWMRENINFIKEQLRYLQESVDKLTGNQTLENGHK